MGESQTKNYSSSVSVEEVICFYSLKLSAFLKGAEYRI